MKNMKYESPKFIFQELKLVERVADTCWGFHYGWFDADSDGAIDPGEKIDLARMGSCNSVEKGLDEYLKKNYPGLSYTNSQIKTNVNDKSLIKPINS